MLDAVAKILAQHELIAPGDRVLVSVSGGADSVVLLDLLCRLAPEFPFTVFAAHLDHGLRPESAADAEFVARLCAEWEIPLTVERIDVRREARERGTGLEEAGREVRRVFLRRVAEEQGCAVVALGHHRDDQAETFLHRLLRGTGLSGLAAMREKSGPFIRPLLGFSRKQLRDYLTSRRLAYVEDASNADPDFTRNRLRHELLPLLAQYNPRVAEHLARLSRRIAGEEDYWRTEVERRLDEMAEADGGGFCLDRPRLLELHPALRRRVLRGAIGRARGSLRGISSRHIEDVNGLLVSDRPQSELRLPGLWVARRYETLHLRRNRPPAPAAYCVSLEGPGTLQLPGGEILTAEVTERVRGEAADAVEFDAAGISWPLQVRTFRAGDRFRPAGAPGGRKLKDFFIDARIEKEIRGRVPLVVCDEVLWVVGIRRCDGRRPLPGGKVVRLTVQTPSIRD